MKIVYIPENPPHLLYIQQTETKWRLHTVSFHLKKKLLQYYHVFCFRFVLFDDRHWDIYDFFLYFFFVLEDNGIPNTRRNTTSREHFPCLIKQNRKKNTKRVYSIFIDHIICSVVVISSVRRSLGKKNHLKDNKVFHLYCGKKQFK